MTGYTQLQTGSSQIWLESFTMVRPRIFPHLVDHVWRPVAAARIVNYIVSAAVFTAAAPAAGSPNVRRSEWTGKPGEDCLVSTTFWLSTGNLLNRNSGLTGLYRSTCRSQETVFLTDNAESHFFETHCSYRPLRRFSTTLWGGAEPA